MCFAGVAMVTMHQVPALSFMPPWVPRKYGTQQKSEQKQTTESGKKGSMATVSSQPVPKTRQRQKSTGMVGSSSSSTPTCLKQLVVPIMVRQRHGKALMDTGVTYTLLHLVYRKVMTYAAEEKGREAERLHQLLLSNPWVCTITLGHTSMLRHKIKLKDDVVVTQHPYRLPLQKRIVKEQIEEMLQQGVIVPSHSTWASPIVLVPKKDHGAPPGFCVDFRHINKHSEGDAFPLLTISEILESLAGSSMFTTLDLNSAYWQVEMDPESQPLTAFVTCFGLFHFRVMPFILKGALATFQRLMTQVLRSCLGDCCMGYLDDIIIYSKDVQTHLYNIQRMKKCRFCCPELKVLGHEQGGKDGSTLRLPCAKKH
eukprot:superscaffoldBa00003783_g17670